MPSTTNRDAPFSSGNLPFQLMNMVPNPKRPQDRWSDAPGFQGARIVPHPMGGEQFQMMLDPEKHIERTSAYEGSTDRRDPFSGDVQSAHDTWGDKKKEAALDPGHVDSRTGLPVHGAGILHGLRQGETIRDPVRLLIEPSRFPRSGNQPVQHEGHHRVGGAALRQKELRDAGEAAWSVPVPFEIHHNVAASNAAEDAMKRRVQGERRTGMSNRIVKGAYGGTVYR
jgi:hypothetical protein